MRTPPPRLLTLRLKPTWHNRAGRVDRSACFTLTASTLWRLVHDDNWRHLGKREQTPKPSAGRARRLKHPDRTAELTLTAHDLWVLHKFECPHPLRGDYRSPKSNAMRCAGLGPEACGLRITHTQDSSLRTQDATNPNRGVGFNMHKALGLPATWQTTLRIERFAQHAKLKQHFLVCPACGTQQRNTTAAGSQSIGAPTQTPAGCEPAASSKLPPGRVTRLYLPLCTPQERADARLAQLWLRTHTHPNRPLTQEAAQLIKRYGELFEPRQLRCRKCLGLRYGEVKAIQNPLSPRERAGVRGRQEADQHAPTHRHPVAPRPTEQTLFLTNLPKLLAPVPDASGPAGPQRRRVAEKNAIDMLPDAEKDKLLLLLAEKLPAFQRLRSMNLD